MTKPRLCFLTDDLQNLQRRQERVNASHESFEKDHFRQADAEHFQVARKTVQIVEIVQLHGGGKVQREILQIGTFIGQLVQHVGRDQFHGQFDELEREREPMANQDEELIEIPHVQPVVFRPQKDHFP